MKRLCIILLFLIFSFSDVLAQKKWKRLFNPKDQITLGIGGKFITVPYAYLRESPYTILKREGIVNVHEHHNGGVNFQYLYPSLAPPPENCSFENKPCTGTPVTGFPTAPKGEKQFYVQFEITPTSKIESFQHKIDLFFKGSTAEKSRKEGVLKDRKDLGLIEDRLPGKSTAQYIPIEPLTLRTFIFCFFEHCNIFQEDDDALLEYRVLIHRDQLPHWRGYLASSHDILKKYPLK